MTDDSPPTPLLRNRDFLLFVAGRSSNTIAVQALTVAVGWHVYQISHDPVDLGLVGLAQFAPALALFLVAGLASDRFDRRSILMACNLVHAIVVGLLLAILWTDAAAVAPILAVLVLHGAARSFYHTASQAILPNLVPRTLFPSAIAYSSSASKAAQLLGPALGGLLIAWTGNGVYWTTLALFATAGVCAAAISARLKVQAREPFSLATVLGGFTYVWANKLVLGAISIDLMAVLFGGVMGLLPVFASDILHVGPDGLGLLRAMPAVGSLVIGLALTQVAAPRHMGPMFFASLAVFGLSIVGFSLSETFWLSLLFLGIYGAADMVSVYIRQTLVQIATPDGMRGRVSAVNSVSINASNELGDFRAGVMAGGIGTVAAVLVGGVVTVGITALWWRLFPGIRRIDRLDDLVER
ncbi:MFS transporter [Thalassobaculum sp.]|uniref:MFS transporter n=1 Tax=Thalassobaculum sp. TaxID=2022740 RepID=UPI0032ED3E9B